jgi:hypothetical protein
MQHRPQYRNLPIPTHLDDAEQETLQSQRRLWWLLAGLAVLSLFLIGMAMWRAW